MTENKPVRLTVSYKFQPTVNHNNEQYSINLEVNSLFNHNSNELDQIASKLYQTCKKVFKNLINPASADNNPHLPSNESSNYKHYQNQPKQSLEKMISQKQIAFIFNLGKKKSMTKFEINNLPMKLYNVPTINDLTSKQGSQLIKQLTT